MAKEFASSMADEKKAFTDNLLNDLRKDLWESSC